ncbi:MAG: helix-turn-helix transcriptional regulator [Clostridia bacterium]|nr:helix-turn-helix transcriptional regulator [Clostridia bacterium]
MDQVKVGAFLASLRREKGLTQEALAERIGVTNKTISRWETGTYMPDVEMLLILGEQFNVTVNELLCGERLSDGAMREKGDSNIKYLAATNKKRVKRVFVIALVAVLCVTLLWLSVFSVYFVVNRRAMLYPDGASDRNNAKRYLGEYTVTSSSVGSRIYTDENGHSIHFDLPNEYTNDKMPNLFANESKDYVRIASIVDPSDALCPTTLALSKYFAQEGIIKYTDKIAFAYKYDLKQTTIFSSSETIEIAAGVRVLRTYGSAMNEEGDTGLFYKLTGDVEGYAMSTSSTDPHMWFVCIENEQAICFLNIKTDSKNMSIDALADFLSNITLI